MALVGSVPGMILEPCPLWHWPLPGPGHWALAVADAMEATVPTGSCPYATSSVLGALRVADGPSLPAGTVGTWAHMPGSVTSPEWGQPPQDTWPGTAHSAGLVGREASHGLEGLCGRYNVISLNIYLVVRLFYFFLVKEKEKKTSFSFAS